MSYHNFDKCFAEKVYVAENSCQKYKISQPDDT